MPNINIELEGYIANVVDRMLSTGYAKTKTEAIRLALFEFDQVHKLIEDELYAAAAARILEGIDSGRQKTTRYVPKVRARGLYGV